ncbi:MAG: hypothetical protein WCK02_00265 [Bacteroidota bacterium]
MKKYYLVNFIVFWVACCLHTITNISNYKGWIYYYSLSISIIGIIIIPIKAFKLDEKINIFQTKIGKYTIKHLSFIGITLCILLWIPFLILFWKLAAIMISTSVTISLLISALKNK